LEWGGWRKSREAISLFPSAIHIPEFFTSSTVEAMFRRLKQQLERQICDGLKNDQNTGHLPRNGAARWSLLISQVLSCSSIKGVICRPSGPLPLHRLSKPRATVMGFYPAPTPSPGKKTSCISLVVLS
jgi:hypothetical protein